MYFKFKVISQQVKRDRELYLHTFALTSAKVCKYSGDVEKMHDLYYNGSLWLLM